MKKIILFSIIYTSSLIINYQYIKKYRLQNTLIHKLSVIPIINTGISITLIFNDKK